MGTDGEPRILLQIIENMNLGGAQRTAARLMKLPGVTVELATYDQLEALAAKHYAGILLHVWCAARDQDRMNWPHPFNIKAERLLVFNHDWHGNLNVKADGYVVYSKFAARHVLANGPVFIIPGAVPYDQYQRTARPINQAPNLISIGRLSTMHGGKINIDAVRYWPEINADIYWVAGEGSERPEIQKAYEADKRFRFPGPIEPRNVPAFLSRIDIFLYDTAWHTESFCYVILEAMAAGCVVVARNRGAIAELISPGRDGFLFETEAEAIEICNRLIRTPTARNLISTQARRRAQAYSLEKFYWNVLSAFDWA